MAHIIRIRHNKVTSYVGPFEHKVLAEDWIAVSLDWLVLNYPNAGWKQSNFRVLSLAHPYKARTVSLLTIHNTEGNQ